ncbi:hypothetical protein BCR33DRAFT_715947 [Rhizoclosmatium globosum]|uniref:Uncharacterized protein n=1 Tax=Rhizoclosmatium globosum TaxID=329046 RepID=A0A1Y2CFU2_9FUNG|nr:hypothetical protein BCR33DRAFT_715947 [Rhizoclosmatium globosum]|eukprot:ORY45920.1 hypothetical protein BCR33DRAFT_715947 [Rhizoclosmatium globosum]
MPSTEHCRCRSEQDNIRCLPLVFGPWCVPSPFFLSILINQYRSKMRRRLVTL